MYSSNIGVREYQSLLFHRGIYEGKSIKDAGNLMSIRAGCSNVYIESRWAFPDLPELKKATITRLDGSVEFITKE